MQVNAVHYEEADPELLGEPTRLQDLPPMKTPDLATMRSQACTGTVVVLLLIAMLAGLPHASKVPPYAGWAVRDVGFTLLYIEAGLAIACLLGLMWGDPGTLKRSQQTCFPLPTLVSERLRAGISLEGLDNIHENGLVFCVRCCIWRRDTFRDATHHCSICNRCVRDFDHHCGVFGRCIAGKGMRGNMGFFKGILFCAMAGVFTCVATMAASADVEGGSTAEFMNQVKADQRG